MLDQPNRDQISNDLIARWQQHRDERARDRLTTMHWPLIRAYGSRLASRYGLDVDDATQEAALAFLRAIDTHSPELGTLASFAHIWAKSRVRRFHDDTDGTIRVPIHVRDRNRVLGRAFVKLKRTLGRVPTSGELIGALGWSEERLRRVRDGSSVAGPLVSTSAPVGEDGDMELGDTIAADEETRPDVSILGRHAAEQARMAILQATELLPERWRKILALRLVEGRTLIETGEALGVTRERVRQIETKVIERLREALRYDPRALNLIGLDVEAPETVTRADADGLAISDIAYLTGMSAKAVDQAIAARTFPEPARHAYHRGTRLWDPAAVAEWMARRDAASASTAEEPSPGIPAPDAHEAPPAPASAALEPIRAPAEASVPSEPEAAPRPSCAPALAHALMGECSVLAVFVATLNRNGPTVADGAVRGGREAT